MTRESRIVGARGWGAKGMGSLMDTEFHFDKMKKFIVATM